MVARYSILINPNLSLYLKYYITSNYKYNFNNDMIYHLRYGLDIFLALYLCLSNRYRYYYRVLSREDTWVLHIVSGNHKF